MPDQQGCFLQIDIKRPEKKLKSDFSLFFVAKIGINLVAILSRRVIVKKFWVFVFVDNLAHRHISTAWRRAYVVIWVWYEKNANFSVFSHFLRETDVKKCNNSTRPRLDIIWSFPVLLWWWCRENFETVSLWVIFFPDLILCTGTSYPKKPL